MDEVGIVLATYQQSKGTSNQEDPGDNNSCTSYSTSSSVQGSKLFDVADEEYICLCGGRATFILDNDTIERLNSKLLNDIIISEPEVLKFGHRCFSVDADSEAFFSFVQMARYETLPVSLFTSSEKYDKLLKDADFWGIRSTVIDTISNIMNDLETRATIQVAGSVCDMENEPHHNSRRKGQNLISIGSYCTQCSYTEDRCVFLEGELYASCKSCNKDIFYRSELSYCHKCCCCIKCQTTSHCIRNTNVHSSRSSQTQTQISSLLTTLEEKVKALRGKL